MKKVNFRNLVWLLATFLVLTGCSGLSKMQKNAQLIKLEATPKMLEMHADNVDISINGNIPPKYFAKKVTVNVVPVLKYENGEKNLKSIKLQGEKVQANDGKVINYENGGGFSISDKFAYSDDMKVSTVSVKVSASYKDKTVDLGTYKVADGIIATPRLVRLEGKTIFGTVKDLNKKGGSYDPMNDEFQRNIPVSRQADIMYPIQKSDIKPTELKKDDINAMKLFLQKSKERKDSLQLKGIDVTSFASPDGPWTLNDKLSKSRGGSATGFIGQTMKEEKKVKGKKPVKKTKQQLADEAAAIKALISEKVITEDWDGFKELMQKSDIKDKDLVLRVLQMYSDPEVRNKEIKNISATFKEIADKILPKLRRSKFNLNADIIGKSDETILRLATSKPDSLNPAEFMYAAKLTDDLNKKAQIYKSMSEIYKDDWRGKNNLGVVYLKQNKIPEAKAALEDAKKIDGNNIVLNNLGVATLMGGNFTDAESLFKAGLSAGKEPDYNLGIISIKNGNYAEAIKHFGSEQTFNSALARLLSGDLSGASTTLDNIKDKDAMVYYLYAVTASRQQNENGVFTNLKQAVDKDSTLAGKAKTDMEFFKFFDNPKFKEIVK
ncbi:MAG: hypothetical protein NTW49_03860 [Bacteroidia bacterium]|nr:hypothetical protein [Bacteroidia bacterium]